jgi:hypothetical protein
LFSYAFPYPSFIDCKSVSDRSPVYLLLIDDRVAVPHLAGDLMPVCPIRHAPPETPSVAVGGECPAAQSGDAV